MILRGGDYELPLCTGATRLSGLCDHQLSHVGGEPGTAPPLGIPLAPTAHLAFGSVDCHRLQEQQTATVSVI